MHVYIKIVKTQLTSRSSDLVFGRLAFSICDDLKSHLHFRISYPDLSLARLWCALEPEVDHYGHQRFDFECGRSGVVAYLLENGDVYFPGRCLEGYHSQCCQPIAAASFYSFSVCQESESLVAWELAA